MPIDDRPTCGDSDDARDASSMPDARAKETFKQMAHGYTPRQLSEIAFHDDAAWPFESWRVDESFCDHLRPRHREFLGQLDQLFPNGFDSKHVLDCGCGVGALSVLLALRGAQVDAFDLSPKMVTIAQRAARESSVESMARFQVAALDDALLFDAGTFDAVVGTDVLHHVDLATAATELNRVLKTDAYAVFLEPVATSCLQNIVRTLYYHLPLVPKRASEYEHAITTNELAMLSTVFHTMTVSPCCFNLFQHVARGFVLAT